VKRSKLYFLFLVLINAAVLLAACGGTPAEQAESTESNPTETPMPPPEALEEASQTVEEAPPAEAEAEAYPPPAAAPAEAYPPAAAPVEAYPADAAAGAGGMRTFVVLPDQSSASYLVDEEFLEDALSKLGIAAGDVDVVGTTPNVSGQIQINTEDYSLGETTFTADMTALRTDQNRRDGWLQENGSGPQFARFPEATFVATGVSGLPDSYSDGEVVQFQLSGDFTVRDTTVPLTFDVTAKIDGDTLTAKAEKRLLMSDLGITPPNFARTLSVADEFGIEVNITAQEG
jgi:polyisoprenoid-binding protein YceI